jgi:hypothetical protein
LEHKFEKADKATLYRTLKTFEENKLIHSNDDGTGSVKYALCQETCECHPEDLHVHFYASICGQTYCLTDISVSENNLPLDSTRKCKHGRERSLLQLLQINLCNSVASYNFLSLPLYILQITRNLRIEIYGSNITCLYVLV